MKEVLVSFDTAKLLKERGFDWYCDNVYTYTLTEQIDEETGDTTGPFGWKRGELNLEKTYFANYSAGDTSGTNWCLCAAPTQALLQQWLREVHNIDIIVTSNLMGYGYLIYQRYPPKNITNNLVFEKYEQALEAGILETIKLIKIS